MEGYLLLDLCNTFDGDEWPVQKFFSASFVRHDISAFWRFSIGNVKLQLLAIKQRRRTQRSVLRAVFYSWLFHASENSEEVIGARLHKSTTDKSLDLSALKLRILPQQVVNVQAALASTLTKLDLASNYISFLPRQLFERVLNLNVLKLTDNRIRSLPSTLSCLQSLQFCLLDKNDFVVLTPAVGDLKSLHTLHIQSNPNFTSFPLELGKKHHVSLGGTMRELLYDYDVVEYPPPEVSENGLAMQFDFLSRIWKAAETGYLSLGGMNLKSIPHFLYEHPLRTRITELNISQNKIDRLPPAFGLMTSLTRLRMDENFFVFPSQHMMRQSSSFRDLESRTLTEASKLPFMHFLRRIATCKYTREIVLSGGEWMFDGTRVEISVRLIAPELFFYTNCAILDVRGNDIKTIPEEICKLVTMTKLLADKNRVRTVPDTLSKVTCLQVLSLAVNEIRSLPDIFSALGQLSHLNVSSNQLKVLPSSITSCGLLSHLYVDRNEIHSFPKDFNRLLSLRVFHFGHNSISQLSPQLGASWYLEDVNAEGCFAIQESPQEILNGSTSFFHKVEAYQSPHTNFDASLLVRLLATPTGRRITQLPPEMKTLANLKELMERLERETGTPVQEIMFPSCLEGEEEDESRIIEYLPPETIYTRNWRLTKMAQVDGKDANLVNRKIRAKLAPYRRRPPLVRYLWGLWSSSSAGLADFSGTGMVNLKFDILSISWITRLSLSYNRVSTLPAGIGSLTQLQSLDLSHNLITSLPPQIGQLTSMKQLDLSFNMLDSLPKEMSSLPDWSYPRDPRAKNLFSLDWITGNPISFPHPQILQLGPSHVRGFLRLVAQAEETGRLDFQQRELPIFPEQLTGFTFLQQLDLSSNKIDRIPPAFTSMVNLKEFTIAGNNVDRLPTRMSSLTSLEILDVRDNQLKSVPEGIGMLHARLVRLNLGRNVIESLPPSIGLLSNLRVLELNWNLLSFLPAELESCRQLEELLASYNQLRQLPHTFSNLTNLRVAAIQSNRMELLPSCFGNMPNLTKLAHLNNPWKMPQQEMLSWPEEFEQHDRSKMSMGMRVWGRIQLTERMRFAKVDAINEDGTFDLGFVDTRDTNAEIRKERKVRVEMAGELLIKPLSSHDRLVDFMSRIHLASKHKELDLSGCYISEFIDYDGGAGFKHVVEAGWYTRGLRKLLLSHNRLSTLPPSISRLSSLTVLQLQQNSLLALPETLSCLISLVEIDVSHNLLTVLPCGLGIPAELETIVTHHNPLLAPPPEVVRGGAQVISRYLRGVHLARRTGELYWEQLGLCSIDTLTVMLPDGEAATLRELYLDDNLLVVFNPSVLAELAALRVLRCCNNFLTFLHPNVGLFCTQLEQLTLDGNRLSHLPHTLGTLTGLLAISADRNPHLLSPPPEVNALPSSVKIRFLQQMSHAVSHQHADLSDFGLQAVPPDLLENSSIRVVLLGHNQISSLPPSVQTWTSLVELCLQGNRINRLPASIGFCTALTSLDLRHNRLRRLPPEMGRMRALNKLLLLGQQSSSTRDTAGLQQGFMWSTEEATVGHVHNLSGCDEYVCQPNIPKLVCPSCLAQGLVMAGTFDSEEVETRLHAYLSQEEERQRRGKPSVEFPTVECPTCGERTRLSELKEPRRKDSSAVREWIPSRLWHHDVWSPELPQQTFSAFYTRSSRTRSPSDNRHIPDIIETPPMLGGEGDAHDTQAVVSYLARCLEARGGSLALSNFYLLQFPLEALDLSGLRTCDVSHNSIKDLPTDLDRLTRLRSLRVDHNILEMLPPGLRFLTSLTELLANDNMLEEVCPEIGACVHLTRLNLHANKLVTLPHTIGNCSLLTQLTIHQNKIKVIPPSLSNASNITMLELDGGPEDCHFVSPPPPIPSQSSANFMRYLKELYTYSKEKRLFTPGYGLEEVPGLVLEAATCVVALNLDANNISQLPEEIGHFTLLDELFSICDNELVEIPESVGNLVRLRSLRLSGNNLTMLPDSLSELVCLEEFLVDHNNLQDFNRCFSTMTCLHTLSIADNNIKEVYPEFGLISSLTSLNFVDNPVVLPGPEVSTRVTEKVVDYLGRIKVSQSTGCLDLANLDLFSLNHQVKDAYTARVIDLRHNHIAALPHDFALMVHCQELLLDGNPMSHLEDSIGKLVSLEVLSVERMADPLRAFPEVSFAGLRKLVVLKAAHNEISMLPDVFKFVSHVEYVDLSSNMLTQLPPSMTNCRQLKVLLVNNNRLKQLFKGCSNLKSLHTLDISQNKLTRLSRGLGGLYLSETLKNFDLSGNEWEMPPDEITSKGEQWMLKYVGELWKAKLANGISLCKFSLSRVYEDIIQDNLVELALDDNEISIIPPSINRLKRLEDFSIQRNKLTEIPEELWNLRALSVLKLDDNKITSISRNIVRLASTLTWFSIERNFVTSFPVEFAQMEMLEIFNCSTAGLDADVRHAYESGLETFMAYMRAWSTVKTSGRLDLNWDASLAWDPLQEMPAQLWRFADRLTVLYLNENSIMHLPYNIFLLYNLRHLSLDKNNIQSLPYSLCRLTALEALSLQDNNDMYDPPYDVYLEFGLPGIMSYLKALDSAPSSRTLEIQSLKLNSLKINDAILTTLESLSQRKARADVRLTDGRRHNEAESLQIAHRLALMHISSLNLDYNEFDAVPPDALKFTDLVLLSVAHNKVESLTDRISVLSNLTVLELEDNLLQHLPQSLEGNRSLVKLTLNRNQFQSFPEVIFDLSGLQILNLALNQIELVPEALCEANTALKLLALQHNQIHALPSNIGLMANLILLDLTQNHIISLPSSISACQRLRALFLSGNPLPSFPRDVLLLSRLQQLRCSSTQLSGVPPELGLLTCLKELLLSDNERLVWPTPDVLEQPIQDVLSYLRTYLEAEEEEDGGQSGASGPETRGVSVDSFLAHNARLAELMVELQELTLELEEKQKELAKHTRIGNKSKVAELQGVVDELNYERQMLAHELRETEELGKLDENLLLIEAELSKMENPAEDSDSD